MEEKLLLHKNNGLMVLLLTTALYIAAIAACAGGCVILEGGGNPALFIIGIVWLCVGWIPWCGLKVLKPQEALVLTLFGDYIGTLKNEGFYFVNPFCTAVNPAAQKRLRPTPARRFP